jgi:dTDP-4-dehydrorhamnose 3,5-epimerase
MQFFETKIPGATIVRPKPHLDSRGSFARVFCVDEFASHGLETTVAQVNLAVTSDPGTVRGIHYQLPPAAEAKLVRCVRGAVFDVVVDLRAPSPTFGSYVGIELTAEEAIALYVPPGCGHGYQALSNDATLLYQVSAPYTPALERGVHPLDPGVGIRWPLPPTGLSSRDRTLPPLGETDLPDVSAG